MNAIYPGTFDPVTNGHIDIAERSSKMFEKLTPAVIKNPNKIPLFTVGFSSEIVNFDLPSASTSLYIQTKTNRNM